MVYRLNLCFYFLAEALRKALTILINAISLSLVFAFLLGRKSRKTNATRENIRADVRGLGRRKQRVLQIYVSGEEKLDIGALLIYYNSGFSRTEWSRGANLIEIMQVLSILARKIDHNRYPSTSRLAEAFTR
ncbi:hypothetical protein SO802_017941 [Lithocarpus litseifolius]|uniref:Uncharacterized protein n=1 Tax=Lithocarpus litseifolius TaxID=425828 RepID=A0AAW2CKP1_9ROSI